MDFKIVFLGPSNAGKTSIIERFCSNVFNFDTLSTIGAQFFTKSIEVNNELVNLYIWDTAGDERFESMQTSYIRGANGLVLAYDLANPNYNNLKKMLQLFRDEVKAELPEKLPVMVLGNKLDLITDENEKQTLLQQVIEFCNETGLTLHEFVSAKDDININESFVKITQQLVQQHQTSTAPTIRLSQDQRQVRKKNDCC
ncbi:small GTP-binding protein [Histomonas meleagridis]|uniref:small GTP-binding protein n=1 Tax=Histomonas meleagridis TaxID=135588 RepID=UPI00355A6A04|nr:small GTP-binding protein [Histomonas meleagridis]KAH0799346.1 small GTP-binding protein [Histomonas meleagridis]